MHTSFFTLFTSLHRIPECVFICCKPPYQLLFSERMLLLLLAGPSDQSHRQVAPQLCFLAAYSIPQVLQISRTSQDKWREGDRVTVQNPYLPTALASCLSLWWNSLTRSNFRKENYLFGLQFQVIVCHWREVKAGSQAASHNISIVKSREKLLYLCCLFAHSASSLHSYISELSLGSDAACSGRGPLTMKIILHRLTWARYFLK